MIDESDRVIGLIYEGIADDVHWGAALGRVAALVGAAGVGLGVQDMASHQFRGLASHGIDLNLSPTYGRLASTNKIWIEIGRRRRPVTDRMVIRKADFLNTELYADWFKASHQLPVECVRSLGCRSVSLRSFPSWQEAGLRRR